MPLGVALVICTVAEATEKRSLPEMKRRFELTLVKIVVFCLLSALNAQGMDWPCWRGPNSDGKSHVKGIRKDWSVGLKKVWEYNELQTKNSKFDTWSAVSVKDGKVVVPGRREDKDEVFCFDADTGRLFWKKQYAAPGDSLWGGGPRATPYIDGDKVYTFGRMGHLSCWDLKDGKLKWIRNVHDKGGLTPLYGHSSSPLVYKKLVIVQGGGGAQTIAFNKKNGAVVWKSNITGVAGYASPILARLNGRDQILVFNGAGGEGRDGNTPGRIAGLDPRTGKKIWESPWWCKLDIFATTPAVDGDTVFITSGYGGGGCKLVRVAGTKATKVWEHWKDKIIASLHSDPIILDGYIYCYSGMSTGKGELQCVELKTGKLMWSAGEQVGCGTMVLVDRHLLCLSNRGDLFLVGPNPKAFKKVTEFRGAIPDTRDYAWTVPVVANGKLYLRFKECLICYDLMK